MALPNVNESDEDYHSLSGNDDDDGAESDPLERPPTHPVPSLQAAFEESIRESKEQDAQDAQHPIDPDAEARRQRLLESQKYDDSWNTRWKQQSTAQHHPLCKLVAQIIFGMHLLDRSQAKSDGEVIKILQNHIREIDMFLERTSEDFELAITDIEERVRFLKLPMAHMDVFETMLEDRKFRVQLLNGNSKIERIIDLTLRAMNASLLDVQTGLEVTRELQRYLELVDATWPREKQEIAEVFNAMRSNDKGWKRYLTELQSRGNTLGECLVGLATLVQDMSKMASAASKRSKRQSRGSLAAKTAPSSPGLRSKFSQDDPPPPVPPLPPNPNAALDHFNKPLPSQPRRSHTSPEPALDKPHPVPFAQRFERPRESPLSPDMKLARAVSVSGGRKPITTDAKTGPRREPRPASARFTTYGLIDFVNGPNHLNPLRSNPPNTSEVKLGRSRSHGSVDVLAAAAQRSTNVAATKRSNSHSALDVLKASKRSGPESQQHQQPSIDTLDRSIPSVIPEEIDASDDAPQNGFTRRLSKKTQATPPAASLESPSQHQRSNEKVLISPPPDSAYSSGSDKRPPPYLSEPRIADIKRPPHHRKSSSTLSLFPKITVPPSDPLNPTPKLAPISDSFNNASNRGADIKTVHRIARPPSAMKETAQAPSRSPNAAHTPASKRYLSLSRIFHRNKDRSRAAGTRGETPVAVGT